MVSNEDDSHYRDSLFGIGKHERFRWPRSTLRMLLRNTIVLQDGCSSGTVDVLSQGWSSLIKSAHNGITLDGNGVRVSSWSVLQTASPHRGLISKTGLYRFVKSRVCKRCKEMYPRRLLTLKAHGEIALFRLNYQPCEMVMLFVSEDGSFDGCPTELLTLLTLSLSIPR